MAIRSREKDEPRDVPAGQVCLGEIGAARGLRGEVFVRSFTTEPAALADYGPFVAHPGGRSLRLRVVGEKKGLLVVRVDGVGDRDGAEALRGLRLCVPRSRLPEPEPDEFYYADLIGLDAVIAAADGAAPDVGTSDGGAPDGGDAGGFGRVAAVHDFGAGAVLEIARAGQPALLVPFTREAVPVVDLPGRRVVVAPLPGLIDSPGEADLGPEHGAGDGAGGVDEPGAGDAARERVP